MKRGIKLVAIYIGKFGIFENEILNFSSDYTVTLSESTGNKISLLVKYQKKLPENFFSTDSSTGGCVSSVSAIIGNNGTGKTMIARLLCALVPPARNLEENKIVLICEINGELVVCTTCRRENIEVKLGNKAIVDIRDLTIESIRLQPAYPFKFFYYSPHYTTEQYDWDMGDNGDEIFNISTTWLMRNPEGHSATLLPDVSPFTIYDMDEKLRALNFCQAYESKKSKVSSKTAGLSRNPLRNFAVPLPEGVSISPLEGGMRQVLDDMRAYVNACRREQNGDSDTKHSPSEPFLVSDATPQRFDVKVGEYLESVKPFFVAATNCHDFFTRVFITYIARHLRDCRLMELFPPSVPPSRELKPNSYYMRLRDFLRSRDWNKAVPPGVIITFLNKNPPPVITKARSPAGMSSGNATPKKFFARLRKLCALIGQADAAGRPLVKRDLNVSLSCRISEKQVRTLLYQLVELHAQMIARSPFLSFDIIPKMSSGEMAFLSMFARLFHFVSQNTKPEDNVVVFLDEAETTLHPEWQRRLVDHFIRFFEGFIPERHYQLVFASHSPMLLSDIPSGNCCFLQIGEEYKFGENTKHCRCIKFVEDKENRNTFGANIYDLYRGAFYPGTFFSTGAIGEFASRVIDNHLQDVSNRAQKPREQCQNQDNASKDDMALTQALIGDRLLRRYFEILKETGLV